MTSTQKIIKYFAFALAALIIITIVTVIINGVGSIFGVSTGNDSPSSSSFRRTLKNNYNNISRLEIEVSRVNLVIEAGDSFNIETSNKYITSQVKDNTLSIVEKSHKLWERDKGDLYITIPSNKEFEFIGLEAGLGSITIDKFSSDILMLDLGAGKTVIKELIVNKRADIEGGAGSIEIRSGIINNLDMEIGVGTINLTSDLLGESKIDSGVGGLTINLKKSIEEYTFKFNRGIGSIKVNDKKISDIEYDNNGDNIISIDGGVGTTNIYTVEYEKRS